MRALILAGGQGTRLKPYTTVLPKPLMPIGERPILEIIIRQLKDSGFNDIVMCVGHLAGLIEAYFGSGEKLGVKISYIREETPLGTAGPISLVENLDEDFLIMNGDILTDIDYEDLINYHLSKNPIATVSIYNREVETNLGVLEINEEDDVIDYVEKPRLKYKVSMGIYVFNRRIIDYIEKGKPLDLPDLINTLIKKGEQVKGYIFEGKWLDIGRREDYELALDLYDEKRGTFK